MFTISSPRINGRSLRPKRSPFGGHLVTINDQAEQDWVYQTFGEFGGEPRSLWIGLTDQNEEGVFTWVTGEPLTLSLWCPGEPNDTEEAEDYVHIFEPVDHLSRGGTWNDSNDLLFFGDHPVYGVVEVAEPVGPLVVSIHKAVAVRWESKASKNYQVQWTTDLSGNTSWTDLGVPIAGTGAITTFFDVVAPGQVRLYRALELP